MISELAVLLVLSIVIVSIFAVIARRESSLSSLGGSQDNLRWFGATTGSYANDNMDRYWSFTWRGDVTNDTPYPDLRGPTGNDLQAAANQAVHILRSRGGRLDIPVITGWIPHLFYSHLVLADYANMELPLRQAVSPGDRSRILWSGDPQGFDQCRFTPSPPCGDSTSKRWPYSSSYEYGPVFYSSDSGATAISQATGHNQYFVPGGPGVLVARTVPQTRHPSQKAMMWDTYQWYHGTRIAYFPYAEARVPVLRADGSVQVHSGAQVNLGWQPTNPTVPFPTSMTYSPNAWDPPVPAGSTVSVPGRMRWTRQGQAGRDVDGLEVANP